MSQNRYYANLAQATFIANVAGLGISTTSLQVTANENWPTNFPFALWLEPNTLNAEVALVTSGAGTSVSPYVIERGYDGTTPLAHANGAIVTPGVIELDLAEPQQHLNLTGSASGAHGLPASAWLGGQLQLFDEAYLLTGSSTVNIAFTAPSSAVNLLILAEVKSSYLGATTDTMTVQYNAYTGSYYCDQYVTAINESGTSSSVGSSSASSGITNYWDFSKGAAVCGIVPTSGTGVSSCGLIEIIIPNFQSSLVTLPKQHSFKSSLSDNTSAVAASASGTGSCIQVTSSITQLTFGLVNGGQFLAGSLFSIYGF